jgi:hypothetical protein
MGSAAMVAGSGAGFGVWAVMSPCGVELSPRPVKKAAMPDRSRSKSIFGTVGVMRSVTVMTRGPFLVVAQGIQLRMVTARVIKRSATVARCAGMAGGAQVRVASCLSLAGAVANTVQRRSALRISATADDWKSYGSRFTHTRIVSRPQW